MTSCFQNAWLLIKGVSSPIITFRERPCISESVLHTARQRKNCGLLRIICNSGIILDWHPDGTIEEILPQGDKTIFPGKPTYSSFLRGSHTFAEFNLGYITFNTYEQKNYFEFHSDGTVLYRRDGHTFLWSRDFPTQGVEGTVAFSLCDFDDDKYDIYERRDSYS
jgi:hypothetical protein